MPLPIVRRNKLDSDSPLTCLWDVIVFSGLLLVAIYILCSLIFLLMIIVNCQLREDKK